MKNKFAFFANFAETIRETLPEDKHAEAYKAICEYGIYGILPDDTLLKGMCLMARVSIQKADGRSNNGGRHNPEGINQYHKKVNLGQSGQILSETETEIETEAKTKIENINITSSPAYAFEGKVIRLSQKDFDNWQLAFPDLNLRGELMVRDNWLSEQSDDEKKRWFISTQQFFIKQNEKRKSQNQDLDSSDKQNDNKCWF